ncbi:MAG: xanthine dehydrogenase family protein molybdopterin-binding subunit [Chloroflexi bacterium]|nr:xanthine dehydrogenase family protein molybdopterin-binding subunit [Chloroflexota bacterium]
MTRDSSFAGAVVIDKKPLELKSHGEGLNAVGHSVTRVDAVAKVKGEAKFTGDFKMPGLCYAKLLGSAHPHAKIIRVDTSRAEALPGVITVITGSVPENKLYGDIYADQYILARDRVRYVGEPVAAVVAKTEDIARDAIELIDVEYEPLPAIFDVEESMKADCPIVLHPDLLNYEMLPKPNFRFTPCAEGRPNVFQVYKCIKGDVDRAFMEADFIVENRYSAPMGNATPIETMIIDVWLEPDGTVNLRGKTQAMHIPRAKIASVFNLPMSKVRYMAPYIGGGFGPFCSSWPEVVAVLIALKCRRPVRLSLDRAEQFSIAPQKPGRITYVKDGVKKDGSIIAREIIAISDFGAYCGPYGTAGYVRGSTGGVVSTYRYPNFRYKGYGVYTNHHPGSAFRSVGSADMHWGIEQQMDIIAEKLGMDPVQLRMKHILKEGEPDMVGETIHSIGAEECIETSADWLRHSKVPAGPQSGPWKHGKGISLAGHFVVSDMPSWAQVKVNPDGIIEVRHTGFELGQGCDTVVTQVAAEEFNVPVSQIRVVARDTQFTPYEFFTAATRFTYYAANSISRACQDAKRQLFALSAARLNTSPDNLETRNGTIFVKGKPETAIKFGALFSPAGFIPIPGGEIMGNGFFADNSALYEAETGQSPKQWAAHPYLSYGVEIAVNIETGEIRVEKVVGTVDVGRAINPKMVEAQIEGGMAQGLGAALFEELISDEGVVLNPNLVDYAIPSIMEVPSGDNLASLISSPLPHPLAYKGAKGVGELTIIPFAAAVGNALYNAVGVRLKDLPMTREKVLCALNEKNKKG